MHLASARAFFHICIIGAVLPALHFTEMINISTILVAHHERPDTFNLEINAELEEIYFCVMVGDALQVRNLQ